MPVQAPLSGHTPFLLDWKHGGVRVINKDHTDKKKVCCEGWDQVGGHWHSKFAEDGCKGYECEEDDVTAGPETALVAGLVQRIAGGNALKKEESQGATWAGG